MKASRSIGWTRALEGLLISFLVLLICFFILRSSPVINDSNPSDNFEYIDNSQITERKYKSNKPAFYFSIHPQYLPAEKFRLNESDSDFYLAARHFVPSEILLDLWLELDTAYSINNSRAIKKSLLEGQLPSQKSLRSTDHFYLEELSLNTNGGKNILPEFTWYGGNNQFHYWLSEVLSPRSTSLYDGEKVYHKIWEALKWTLAVQFPAYLILFTGGVLLGIYFQLKNDASYFKTVLYGLYSIPLFGLCTIIIFLAAQFLPSDVWTLSTGLEAENSSILDSLKILFLPWICIIAHQVIYLARHTESTLSREMKKRYILAAYSRGLPRKKVLLKHALPNAVVPLITLAILMIPAIISGSVIIEIIFNIPGIGRLFWDSLFTADWPVTLSLILISTIITYVSIWVGDIWYYSRVKLDQLI